MNGVELINFVAQNDERGGLVALEENRNIPFSIARVYYIFDVQKNVRRGFHAHKDLQQVLVCVNGDCKILVDDGVRKKQFELNSPNEGLYIGAMVWREMFDFSEGCVLMVLASQYYNELDYIRNYSEFTDKIKRIEK